MGNTSSPPEASHEQDNVTTSTSSMKKILSDEHVAMEQKSHNTQFPYPQPQNPYAQQAYPAFVSSQQAYPRQNVYTATNTAAYPQQQTTINPQLAPMQPTASTHNIVSPPNPQPAVNYHPTARQLEFQLEQQMQQLRLLQKAQQLERQRLDLARQQRDLDAQKASQQREQNELIRRQQQQEQQERERAQHEATAKAAALARAQAKQAKQAQQRQNVAAKENEERERSITQFEKYPTVFRWAHGGRDVYVAYSGDNWSQKYRMSRSHNDFSLIMEINPGVYHYKFIVDNQWRCALDQKLVRDANGAYTNVLHVRSHSYQQVIDEQKKKRKREKQKAQFQYTQNLPKSDHYVQDPCVCPIHLHKVILNNGNDDEEEETDAEIGSETSDESAVKMKKKKKNNLNTMELPKPLRVSLNHLYVSDRREEEVVTLGMTERYRDKFFTTVYYTPMMETGVNYEDANYY